LSASYLLPTAAGGNYIYAVENKRKNTRNTPLTVGAWNVRTLMDRVEADRPERRSALIARELARYKINIAALSEIEPGYTLFWSCRGVEERREAGVGFAIKE
jgi:hypothetical protein